MSNLVLTVLISYNRYNVRSPLDHEATSTIVCTFVASLLSRSLKNWQIQCVLNAVAHVVTNNWKYERGLHSPLYYETQFALTW